MLGVPVLRRPRGARRDGDLADAETVTGDLAVVVSAEALFTLTDQCGLSPEDAIASAVHTAAAVTRAAFRDRST